MGHRPPYVAVITLAVMTAHHWRVVRLKLALAGISSPMATMPSMHYLLDATENLILESFVSNKPAHDKIERQRFLDRLYAPVAIVGPGRKSLNGSGYVAQPAGFETEDVESSFDAFASAVSGSAR